MQSLMYRQNTAFESKSLINRYQQATDVSPEHIRDAVRAWAASINNQDVVAGLIVEEWERQGGGALDFPDDLSRSRQKLFRWLDGTTMAAQRNIQLLSPAILAVLPLEFRGRLVPQDDFMSRYAAMEKEISEAKQALMLNAPQHQMVKEVREGIEKMLAMLPAEAMGQVLSGLAALAPGLL
ncbi:TPA: toxin YdaT domain-containing protein [Citrobacter freundii]|uniref:toxin YdaT domain-containing protein n=1 Tax=Citrobacter TaxID=544 RepID=UPI0006665DD6|nr:MULTISPECIES: toxin YdaT domain-containing protein [Citrobacter]EGT0625315.1 regulator [Citrobacter freundii]ELF4153238.1 toxin YdaT domain-containing protein [Citrobacter freundii]MBE8729401.1 regulator [Citrobacter freundii]MDM2862892.1 toxin YdaT domain-containing protein [Citrobacter sp. Cpo073]MDM3187960.1 toxin YdaT domain-containing protein [Citrobacter sp. Cf101]